MFYFLIGCYFIIVDTEGQLEIFTKTKTYTNFSNKVFSNCFFFQLFFKFRLFKCL